MGLSSNTTSAGSLFILSIHKCFVSTQASNTGRGVRDTVGNETDDTGEVPLNRSLSRELEIQAWDSKGSSPMPWKRKRSGGHSDQLPFHVPPFGCPTLTPCCTSKDRGSLEVAGVVHRGGTMIIEDRGTFHCLDKF